MRLARVGMVVVGGALATAAAVPAVSTASAPRGAGAGVVGFVSPTGDTLVEKGTSSLRVVVQVRAGARLRRVEIDGVNITGRLRRGGRGIYRGQVPTRSLHYGYNGAFAQATQGGRRANDHVRFIAARRDNQLLRVTSFRTRTVTAPLQIGMHESTHARAELSLAQGVSARVYVNHRRAHRAFTREGRRLIVEVGAAQGLHYGRNLVQIVAHRTHPYKHQSSYDLESHTVVIGRGEPIASAGADHTAIADNLVRLNGLASKLPRGWTGRSFRWRIVREPRGSRARIRNATSSRPTLVPDRAGTYRVRVSVRGVRARARRGLRAAAGAVGGGASNDTTTITSAPDVSPAGVPLDTSSGSGPIRQIALNGRQLEHQSTTTEGAMQYAIIDRRTLRVVNSGGFPATPANMQSVGDKLVDSFKGDLNYFVVFNWYSFGPDRTADYTALNTLLGKIGGAPLTAAQRDQIVPTGDGAAFHGSAVGVAGAPAGSAFVTFAHERSASGDTGGLSGSLRMNYVTGKFDFVFTDPVDFDTGVNQTSPGQSPAQLTMKVGGRDYTQPNPGGGVSGFHLLLLDANSLEFLHQHVFTTNTADGAEQAEPVARLALELEDAASQPRRPLVLLQAFGAPHGNDGAWDRAASAIQSLGGTRQVFDAMNATDPRTLNFEDRYGKGPYAFVGRAREVAPLAESSHSLDGEPGRLQGELQRVRDGGYEPMIAEPPRRDGASPVNNQLIHIVNQAPEPFPAFQDAGGQPIGTATVRAVERVLGGSKVLGFCADDAPTCDIRKSYYQNYRADWSSIQDDLGETATKQCAVPDPAFTEAQCNDIRIELRHEVSLVSKVTKYFGPDGLQEPYREANVTALATIPNVAQQLKQGGLPPLKDNTTSNILLGISNAIKFGGALPGAGAVTTTLSTAFLMGSYFTRDNGSSDFIGPAVSTEAGKLGVDLDRQYKQATDDVDNLGRLIVSDYGKLTAVASKLNLTAAPGQTEWRLGDVGQAREAFVRAAKQTIFERLVSAGYPEMYDLGAVGNARDWYCQGVQFPFPGASFFPDKRLFQDQPDGAQFVARFPSLGWRPLIAVAARNAVGSVGSARIPGVPGAITNELFDPIAKGGLGLNKFQFYSPRNGFEFFPNQPHPAGGPFNSIQQFPYAGDSSAPIRCEDMPNPPGNSG